MSSLNKDNSQNVQNPFLENKPDKSKGSDKKNLSYYFSQYSSATSIHGIQYIGDRSRYLLERLIWIVIVATMFSLCLTLIAKTYKKWVTSPVIVTFATVETPIHKIPFPSITICPEVKMDPELFNYTEVFMKRVLNLPLTPEQLMLEESIRLVCMDQNMPFGNFTGYRNFTDELGVAILVSNDPELDPLGISSISWMDQKKPPLDYVDNIYTSDGVCYNFNMLNINDILKDPEEYAQNVSSNVQKVKGWSLDDGYPDADVTDSFPRRTSLSGVSGGFLYQSMYVNSSHLDYVCGDSLQGFKVILHHPADYPNLDNYFRVPLDTAVYVGIKPRYTTISEQLRHYSPKDRKCYLSNEKPLMYFKIYTQNNCMEECFANYTLETCGCQSFYMPKLSNTPICGPGKRKCVDSSRTKFVKENANDCDCLPSCTSLEYDAELTQSDWNWKSTLNVFRQLGLNTSLHNLERAHLSRLAVYFKENQFLNSERQELYGIVDFFANIGGLLGLFTGFSVTSFVEILYFCTLRLWCNCKKYGRRYWSGEDELLEEKNE